MHFCLQADYEVVCELVHNDQICFQLFKDWTKPDWFGCPAPIESLPPQTVCRVSIPIPLLGSRCKYAFMPALLSLQEYSEVVEMLNLLY